MPRPLAYIHDGYTRRGYIAAVRHLSPELRFTYRPLLAQARAVIFHQISVAQPDEAERIAAETLCAQLVSWTLTDHTGSTVELTVPHILRVEPNLLLRLFQIVTGREITDEDPNWQEDDRADRHQRRTAVLQGQTPEEVERAAVGNSKAGCA